MWYRYGRHAVIKQPHERHNMALSAAARDVSPQTRRASLSRAAKLRPGSKVTVVAPGGAVDPFWLAEGSRILAGWGLDVRISPAPDAAPHMDYLAAADQTRADEFQRAWLDPEVQAVLCARGGYGTQRMVDLVDWAAMAKVPPKVLTGFSDITALHEAIWLRLGVATLYAPNVASRAFAQDQTAQQHLRDALLAPPARTRLTSPTACGLVSGRAQGVTAGGTLSLLAAGLGSADGRERGGFAGCILLLEDIGERCYRIDRMLTHLLRARALDGVAGIALGSWTECGESEKLRDLMLDRLASLGVPVAWGIDFGHCAAPATIPLGVAAELDGSAATLTILEPGLQ